jgi:hypothetical protein
MRLRRSLNPPGGSGGQFKRQYDHTLMEEEHEEEAMYPRDTHPDLYEEHVGMTASMLQHHIAPLVHESLSVAELTSERVEEALEEVLYHQASQTVSSTRTTLSQLQLCMPLVGHLSLSRPRRASTTREAVVDELWRGMATPFRGDA